MEVERRRLNKLGAESLELGTPLAENRTVQAQSRKVDQLIVLLQRKSAGRGSISDNAEAKEEENDGIPILVSRSGSAEIRSCSGSA
ncbi:hypothetical protein D3C86_2073210 [compost metagenome]